MSRDQFEMRIDRAMARYPGVPYNLLANLKSHESPTKVAREWWEAEQAKKQQLQQTVNTSEQLNQQTQNVLNQWQQTGTGGGGVDPVTGMPIGQNPITAPFLPNPTGSIAGPPKDVEDSWKPGAQEAAEIYNLGQPQLDPSNYLDTTMQRLQEMMNPQANPYLDEMLERGQQSVADQFLSTMGQSGRGPGTFDPGTGQINDAALGYLNDLGGFTSDFLGGQYQQDMSRALQAMLGGGDFTRVRRRNSKMIRKPAAGIN